MTQQQEVKQPPVTDPDAIPETLCEGRINIQWRGQIATLTFTHSRAVIADLFDGTVNMEDVVRARIAMSVPNLVALRDMLNRVIKDGGVQEPASGTSSVH